MLFHVNAMERDHEADRYDMTIFDWLVSLNSDARENLANLA